MPSNHGIELAILGHLSEVDSVLVEVLSGNLRVRVDPRLGLAGESARWTGGEVVSLEGGERCVVVERVWLQGCDGR